MADRSKSDDASGARSPSDAKLDMHEYYLNAIDDLKDDLMKKLEPFETIVNKPFMFISDYFYAIRNEIDFEAETMLIRLAESGESNEPNEVENDEIETTLSEAKLNEIREIMIDELRFYEKACLNRLEKLKQLQQTPNIFEDSLAVLSKRKQEIRKDYVNARDSATNETKAKECFMQLKTKYDETLREIERELNKFKSLLLNEKTILFKKHYLNKFGILVIFETVYLNDYEIKCIK